MVDFCGGEFCPPPHDFFIDFLRVLRAYRLSGFLGVFDSCHVFTYSYFASTLLRIHFADALTIGQKRGGNRPTAVRTHGGPSQRPHIQFLRCDCIAISVPPHLVQTFPCFGKSEVAVIKSPLVEFRCICYFPSYLTITGTCLAVCSGVEGTGYSYTNHVYHHATRTAPASAYFLNIQTRSSNSCRVMPWYSISSSVNSASWSFLAISLIVLFVIMSS